MDAQTLEQAYYLGELISVIAVVISLIYVGIGVRQNTLAVKSSTLQAIAENQLEVHSILASNGDLANIVFSGATGTGSNDGVEKFRFTSWMHMAMRSMENAYFQYHEGTLDQRNWNALCRQYLPILHSGFNKTYWKERGFMFSEDFKNFIDKELMSTSMPEGWSVPGSQS